MKLIYLKLEITRQKNHFIRFIIGNNKKIMPLHRITFVNGESNF